MSVRVRFAPSPTGYLHIGGARTALFNFLFARHHGGKHLLRIEDTDKERSTTEAIDAIYEGLAWLGLMPDEDPVMQSHNVARHVEVANILLASGNAYRCYATKEELADMRRVAESKGQAFKYDGRWRNKSADEAPQDVPYSIRLKAPENKDITIDDAVQGCVTMNSSELDDMIVLRSDNTPTYLLAALVDDHDMGITHIVRGDDHFTNSFRQKMIADALGWEMPHTTHVPLIHGADGAKLSKRHGALGVMEYQKMGFLPEALRNYLLRLGWSHGDDEIISDAQAIAWFDLDGLGKSPSRFDMDKLTHVNAHYIRSSDTDALFALALPFMEAELARELTDDEQALLRRALPSLQERATTLVELATSARFYFEYPETVTEQAAKLIGDNKPLLQQLSQYLSKQQDWTHDAIMQQCQLFAEQHELKLGKIMQPIRASITGSHASPSMFEVMELLGKAESLRRMDEAL
jgi:glutamyl-tRNA synthetase